MRSLIVLCLATAIFAGPGTAQTVKGSWSSAKRAAEDDVYHDNLNTLYCGCDYTTARTIDLAACGVTARDKYVARASKMEWEHIVPASLMPAANMSCWQHSESNATCAEKNLKTRSCCERVSQPAKNMIFDLHNMAPSVGQVNAYRLHDRYGVVADGGTGFEDWPGCDAQHFRASSTREHRFEPPDCAKGDVARVWFYMNDQHGVAIPDVEWNMFVEWDQADPISPWELERDRRIAAVQGNHNPYVRGAEGDADGACPWDPQ